MKMSENAQKELIGGFDLLLRTNVQHIWEQIFLSLDYVSFRNCMKVSPEWNEVFHRKSFRAKIVTKFSALLWMDTENLERKMWKSSKNILAWTANSEEVAYVEGEEYDEEEHWGSEHDEDDKDYHMIIHFINKSGKLRSRKVEGMSSRCNIWILHNIILVKTDSNLNAITKQGLEQSTVASFDKDEPIDGWTTHFSPAFGFRFLHYISGNHLPQPEAERGCIFFGEVPIDYSEEKDFNTCRHESYHGDDDIELRFNDDGSLFLCGGDINIHHGLTGFAIDVDTSGHSGVKIRELWNDECMPNARRANSKYVVYVEGRTLFVRGVNEEDADQEVHYDFWPDDLELSDYYINIHDIILTDRHVFAFFSYWRGGMKKDIQGCIYKESVLMVDLEARESYHQKHAFGNYAAVDETKVPRFPPKSTFKTTNWKTGISTDIQAIISWGDHSMKINDGSTVIHANNDQGQLFLFDLTSGDPEKVLKGRRVITSRAMGNKSSSVMVKNIIEVKQGMCLFEAGSEHFTLELIAWKGEPLPKAVETWCEWLDGKM